MKHKISIFIMIGAILLSIYLLKNSTLLGWVIVIELVVFVCITLIGASFIKLNYFLNNINKGKNEGIALTFDDGPDEEITPQILDLLAKENIKANFFVIGNKIAANKDLLFRIYDEGHVIGNHSFSHTVKTTFFTTKKLVADFNKCSQIIAKTIGEKPMFFRPPFGITTPRYNRALKQLNMKSIGWSVRSLDTVETDKDKLYRKITTKLTNGSILLFHDTQKITLEVLPDVISYCRRNGIKIAPLPEIINENPYE